MSTPLPALSAEVVLHSPITGTSSFACERWSLPGIRPAMISVVPTSPATSAMDDAIKLAAALRSTFARLASGPGQPCRGPGPDGCRTHGQPAATCVLVLVGDGTPVMDYSATIGIWTTRRGDSRYVVVPVCAESARTAFLTAVQPYLPLTKAFAWTRQPREAVPAILNAAGLTARDYRVFISYFQKDGRDHADDLQAALGRRGFDVFLDRTSIAVGQDIGDRIREEIVHKSVLIVLETPLVTGSQWVPKEIATAVTHRVGLLAVNFPNGGRVALSDRRREFLSPTHLDTNGRLTPQALDLVCQRVSRLHDFWLFRRRYQMQRAMSHALLHHGLTNHRLTPNGWLDVVPAFRPSSVCSVLTTPRVAELSDFRRLDASLAPAGSRQRGVVAPGTLVAGTRQADMRWLSSKTATGLFDESEINRVARTLADPSAQGLA